MPVDLVDFSFQTRVTCASNVATARALKNLKLGQPVFVSGSTTAGDGSGGLYSYTTATVVDDGINTLSVADGGGLVKVSTSASPAINLSFSTFSYSLAMSFTRATTATVTDHLGVINVVDIGELRHQGLRRVKNLAPSSQDLSAGTWTVENTAIGGATAQVGGLTAQSVEENTTSTVTFNRYNTTLPVVSGMPYVFSAYMATGARTWGRISAGNATGNFSLGAFATARSVYFNIATGAVGTIGSAFSSAGMTAVDGGYLCWAIATCTGTGTAGLAVGPALGDLQASYAGTVGSGIYVTGVQLAQASAFPGYVSTNVAASPAFHGAYVDGVKYFTTDASGVAISEATREGVLIEEARTNLCQQSLTPSASWNVAGMTLAANQTGITGAANQAVTLTDDGLNGGHFLSSGSGPTYTVSQAYALTAYVKPGTATRVQLTITANSFPTTAYANFSLVGSGSVLATGAGMTSPTITLRPDGFYRISGIVTATATTAGSCLLVAFIDSDTATRIPIFTGTGLTLIFGGGQTEAGTFPTSIIPTTTVTATRNADNLSFTLPGAFSAAQGTWFVDTKITGIVDSTIIEGNGASGLTMSMSSTGLAGRTQDRHSTLRGSAIGATQAKGERLRLAFSYDGETTNLYSGNGATALTSFTPGQTDYSTAIFAGSRDGTSRFANESIRAIRWYPRALTQTQLNALTA